jgi:hypothetical protein
VVTVVSLTQFTLNGSVYAADGAGGEARLVTAPNISPIPLVTQTPHGFFTGDTVRVTGVVGNNGALGDFTVTVTGPNTFTLDGSVATGNGIAGQVQAIASAPTPTFTLKSEKTIQLQGGPYGGSFIVEGTLDSGLTPVFLPFEQFNTGGADEKLEIDALFFAMRVRPSGASGDVTIWIGGQLCCSCAPPPPHAPNPGPGDGTLAKASNAPSPASSKAQTSPPSGIMGRPSLTASAGSAKSKAVRAAAKLKRGAKRR